MSVCMFVCGARTTGTVAGLLAWQKHHLGRILGMRRKQCFAKLRGVLPVFPRNSQHSEAEGGRSRRGCTTKTNETGLVRVKFAANEQWNSCIEPLNENAISLRSNARATGPCQWGRNTLAHTSSRISIARWKLDAEADRKMSRARAYIAWRAHTTAARGGEGNRVVYLR